MSQFEIVLWIYANTPNVWVHSLQHSSDGEPRRQSGGKVFEWVNNQVDPEAHTGNAVTRMSSIYVSRHNAGI